MDFPGLHIDVARHEVTVEGRSVALTPKEFDLLVFLAERPDRLTPEADPLPRVGYDFVGDGER